MPGKLKGDFPEITVAWNISQNNMLQQLILLEEGLGRSLKL